MIVTDIAFHDIRKTGLVGNIDKKRTMLEAFKRKCSERIQQDLALIIQRMYATRHGTQSKNRIRKLSYLPCLIRAAVWGIEKYVARSFFFWMTRFLRTKYETVEIEFIAHHTEANVVDEESFFSKRETAVQSVLRLTEKHYS